MKILLYDAPADHTLVENGKVIHGGQEFGVSDERAEDLLTQPYLSVREVEQAESLSDLTRERLNELAEELGVDAPEKLQNKDAVIAAIHDHQPAAEDGEGPIESAKED